MAIARRRTAVLEISSPSAVKELLALDVQRPYSFVLRIDGRAVAGGVFESPIGDEGWRNVVSAMREATEGGAARQEELRRQAETVKAAGRKLFRHLGELSPELQGFLVAENEPRRLVILSQRPEIHLLPWEAMVDSQWRSVADSDLSVVHALETFDENPVAASIPLTVAGVFGPGTEKRTLGPLQELSERATNRGGGRIVVHADGTAPAKGAARAQVVQVEAHGDPETGELDLERADALETSLSDALGDRAMVLLWSCFSALVHSWGESLGLKLHRQKNLFVLAFATPLRFDTSGEIAGRFYSAVFGDRSVLDPETAVVRERSRLYTDRIRACEWAALTLWLRSPLDLAEAVFQGPRFLEVGGETRELSPDDRTLLESAVQQALPGRAVLVTRFALGGRLPEDLFGHVHGAVVHLRADLPDDGSAAALEALGGASRSAHRGDRLLALVEALEKRPSSLLVWSGVTVREAQAVSMHGALPPSLAVLLLSPWELPMWQYSARIDGGQTNPYTKPPGWIDEISDVEELAEAAGRNRDAMTRALELDRRGGLTQDQQRRLLNALYWAAARLGDHERAEEAARRVAEVDTFAGYWLKGNLLRRRGQYAQARDVFMQAIAQTSSVRDRARAQMELAGAAAETGDRGLAERLYREAILALESVRDETTELRWHSALSRALRDLADLLTDDPAQSADCETVLRRAMVLHNLDGRFGQVGAVLKSQGILERARGRWDRAEETFAVAAGVMDFSGNVGGWASVIEEMAELAFRMGHHERALALIERARSRLERTSRGASDTLLGRLSALEAKVQWRLGSLEKAVRACDEALRLLPLDRAKERAVVDQLKSLVNSLLQPNDPSAAVDIPRIQSQGGRSRGRR